MNVLFEEDGAFKAGTVLADNTTSLQVETSTGKRVKVKAANVLLRFAAPAPGELLERAEANRKASSRNSSGKSAAMPNSASRTWPGIFGRAPQPVEAAAILLRLHAAPIYFHRKGKGRFRKAPPTSSRRRWPAWKKSASRRWPSSAWPANSSRARCRPSSRRC
jgi:exoribonuclease-2